MVFYIFLGLVFLGLVFWAVRSPVVRELVRGHGGDPGQFGNRYDALWGQGFRPSWHDDEGGPYESMVQPRPTRRPSD